MESKDVAADSDSSDLGDQEYDFSISENISSGMFEYDRAIYYSTNSITFEGKTLSEWTELLEFPFIDEDQNLQTQLIGITNRYIELNEIIHVNLAISKASFHLSELSYRNTMSRTKAEIRRNIEAKNLKKGTSRMPGIDTLEAMAEGTCLSQYSSLKLSEIVYEYWQTMSFKLRNIDSRLTNLSILKSAELKAGV